jgi:hypothetical protein
MSESTGTLVGILDALAPGFARLALVVDGDILRGRTATEELARDRERARPHRNPKAALTVEVARAKRNTRRGLWTRLAFLTSGHDENGNVAHRYVCRGRARGLLARGRLGIARRYRR